MVPLMQSPEPMGKVETFDVENILVKRIMTEGVASGC